MEDEIDDQVNLRWFETADPAPFRLARKYSVGPSPGIFTFVAILNAS